MVQSQVRNSFNLNIPVRDCANDMPRKSTNSVTKLPNGRLDLEKMIIAHDADENAQSILINLGFIFVSSLLRSKPNYYPNVDLVTAFHLWGLFKHESTQFYGQQWE